MQAGVEHPSYGTPGLCNFVDARTKWLDAAVEVAAQKGVLQVVIVAAGFDTRAYRLCRPGMQVTKRCWVPADGASVTSAVLPRACVPNITQFGSARDHDVRSWSGGHLWVPISSSIMTCA